MTTYNIHGETLISTIALSKRLNTQHHKLRSKCVGMKVEILDASQYKRHDYGLRFTDAIKILESYTRTLPNGKGQNAFNLKKELEQGVIREGDLISSNSSVGEKKPSPRCTLPSQNGKVAGKPTSPIRGKPKESTVNLKFTQPNLTKKVAIPNQEGTALPNQNTEPIGKPTTPNLTSWLTFLLYRAIQPLRKFLATEESLFLFALVIISVQAHHIAHVYLIVNPQAALWMAYTVGFCFELFGLTMTIHGGKKHYLTTFAILSAIVNLVYFDVFTWTGLPNLTIKVLIACILPYIIYSLADKYTSK